MRHTLACSFHKGAGHLPGCSVQPQVVRGDGEPPGRFPTGREGNDSPHPHYAARCRLTITESPFFAISTLIFLSLNGTSKIPNFLQRPVFHSVPGQS